MGNCTSGSKKKKKGDSAQDDKKPNEDVTYASIEHITAKRSTSNNPRPAKAAAEDDNECDYAVVHIPAAACDSDSSSKEECADDYVLMG
ncbi:uncharacterized protein si:ch211-214p13.7 [Betta splendens]|uniref:Uncharacterized protein si:ch211-214p13.7 n=1 Tax=Betta splendens TaxID=158456 RepID=A0A8M1H967_BETSP|nr:uncharacterized protein si:ch211-214p13.7 [Betta splendens]